MNVDEELALEALVVPPRGSVSDPLAQCEHSPHGDRAVPSPRPSQAAVRGPPLPDARVRRGRADHRGPLLPAGHRLQRGRRERAGGRDHRRPDACGLADRDRRPPAARPRRSCWPTITDPGYAAWVFDQQGELLDPGDARAGSRSARCRATGARLRLRPARLAHRRGPPRRRHRWSRRRSSARAGSPGASSPGPSARRSSRRALEEIRGDRLTAALVALAIAVAHRVPDRERDHLARQAAGRQRRADHRGRARRAARGHRRARRDHRPRRRARDDAASPCARRSARSPRSATASRRSSTRSTDARHGRRRRRRGALLEPGGRAADRAPTGGPTTRCVPWLRRAEARGAAEHDGAAGRRPRLRGRRPQAAGRGRGARRGPRPHRGASPRDRRARVRLQRGARAAQPDRRASRARSRSCAPAPRTIPRRASTSSSRLSEDAERVSRLTESLLTLARMEAVGEGGAEALDVGDRDRGGRRRRSRPRGHRRRASRSEPELVARGRRRAAAPGADRPAHERVQEHSSARRRYASRPSATATERS